MKITGQGYILLFGEDEEIARRYKASLTGNPVDDERHFLIWPKEGKVYDFTSAKGPVLVGGREGVDVRGRKIRIKKFIPGNPLHKAIFEIE